MYYLTITKNSVEIAYRKPFDDFSAAVTYTSQFYKPRIEGCRTVLSFTTEVINGQYARSYTHLTRPEDIDQSMPHHERRYHIAAQQSNAFSYDGSYFFLIETELGIQDAQVAEQESPDE